MRILVSKLDAVRAPSNSHLEHSKEEHIASRQPTAPGKPAATAEHRAEWRSNFIPPWMAGSMMPKKAKGRGQASWQI